MVLCPLYCLLNQNQLLTALPSRNRTCFPAAGKSNRTRVISERNESMKVFLVDDSAIVLEKLVAMISGIDASKSPGRP